MKAWRWKMHEVIFEADTLTGKIFDVALLIAIVLSVVAVMLESVDSINEKYGHILRTVEWVFTILFTIEYIARIISIRQPIYYIVSFLGIVDLVSIIPTYLSLFFGGAQALIIIRTIRLLRVFRIFKLARYLSEGKYISSALKASRFKITVFFLGVVSIVIIMGTLMYLIEGSDNGFTSIPISIYWAVVTLTTVGYGDIAPQTVIGKALATIIMIAGYAIIAVPTGIVTAEFSRQSQQKISTQACPNCGREGHDSDATFCKFCASQLNP
ncbi:MAG: ion transporter [Candidatus Cyclobacteriaceae bacterium M3_2C_046]